MGAKEEELPTRVIFGYAGRVRPLQSVGGACAVCGKKVWIDLPSHLSVRSTDYEHYSCHNGRWLESITGQPKLITNIIPVPVYRK